MAIPNQYKDTLNNLVNSSDDGSDIETLAKLRQIHELNNNIPSLGIKRRGFNDEKDLLGN